MADPKDTEKNSATQQPEIDKIMDLLDNDEEKIPDSKKDPRSSLDYESIKATLDRYKIEAFKGICAKLSFRQG
jgi:hypothetical protein